MRVRACTAHEGSTTEHELNESAAPMKETGGHHCVADVPQVKGAFYEVLLGRAFYEALEGTRGH